MITIDLNTKSLVESLAKKYKVTVEWDKSTNSIFQEQVNRQERKMLIRENIDIDDFDSLFQQHNVNYSVNRDQEMFIFNALHGIGHFELNLWKPNTGDPIVDRLVNFDQDKEVDKWAFNKLVEVREQSLKI